MDRPEVVCRWREDVTDAEMLALVRSHGGRPEPGWWDRVRPHSLGWVTARLDGELVGFVNVAWDGSDHAFLLDTKTRGAEQRRGIATQVVALAARHAQAAGCEWLHVDFRREHRGLYLDACGFQPTDAGLIHLSSVESDGRGGFGERSSPSDAGLIHPLSCGAGAAESRVRAYSAVGVQVSGESHSPRRTRMASWPLAREASRPAP